jgi:hypothetical protein
MSKSPVEKQQRKYLKRNAAVRSHNVDTYSAPLQPDSQQLHCAPRGPYRQISKKSVKQNLR